MTDAQAAIAALDDALQIAGEDVILRRFVSAGANVVNLDVKCRASVRSWRLREEPIVAGIEQAVLIVSISPTQIVEAQWPGGSLPGQTVDPSEPRRNDKLIIAGRLRNIDAVERLALGGEPVRYDMQVLG